MDHTVTIKGREYRARLLPTGYRTAAQLRSVGYRAIWMLIGKRNAHKIAYERLNGEFDIVTGIKG